ncbi:MAG: HDOD domain-containing protein [Deltaproteobacteria bacterium]|nr:HDOD domain-containing protein [Deltaproteobacteria bacterium]
MINIEDITRAAKKLPPFPGVLERALRVLDDPEASVGEVIGIVEHDQAITANVLRLCNSAYYGVSRKVRSLREALVLLGNAQLREVLLAGTLVKFLGTAVRGYDLAGGQLWRHAVATGLMARVISKRVYGTEPPSLFTAALLHDIGKVVLSEFVDQYLDKIMALVEAGQHSFSEAEGTLLGINHAQVGADVAESWNFPDEIVIAIRWHHSPERASGDNGTTRMVHLANILTVSVGIGVGADGLSCRGKQEVMESFGLKSRDLQEVMMTFYDTFRQAQEMLGLA